MFLRSLCLFVVLFSALPTWGRDLYVDPDSGRDEHDGLQAPVKTIARGLQLAGPGDTVHLQPKVYREIAVFHERHGEPEKPITLDGHGAVLEGSEPIDPATWTEVAPGRFRHDHLLRMNPAILGRWYFLWNGQMNHMGRTSKGTHAPLKSPEELQPGEWTFVPDPAGNEKTGNQITGAFYIQLSPGQSLAEMNIAYPQRANGVQLSGKNSHLVIRNITATHVWNDGFNIHGDCHEVLFENIRALECGDDGISAHETAQYQVNGFVSIGNSTGICDIGESRTRYNRVFIRDCLAYDLFFLDQGEYSVRNAIVHSSSENPLTVRGRAVEEMARPCRLELENVFITRKQSGRQARVERNSSLKASHCALVNVGMIVDRGDVSWTESVITGNPAPALVVRQLGIWQGRRNAFDLVGMQFENEMVSAAEFADFQTRTGREPESVWTSISFTDGKWSGVPEGIGVNTATLPIDLEE